MTIPTPDPKPQSVYLSVGLCCNNDHGHMDRLTGINIEDLDGDYLITYRTQGFWFPSTEDNSDFVCIEDRKTLVVEDQCFPIQSHGQYVGNMSWDEVEMELADVVRLIQYLNQCSHWDTEDSDIELDTLLSSGRPLTREALLQILEARQDEDENEY